MTYEGYSENRIGPSTAPSVQVGDFFNVLFAKGIPFLYVDEGPVVDIIVHDCLSLVSAYEQEGVLTRQLWSFRRTLCGVSRE